MNTNNTKDFYNVKDIYNQQSSDSIINVFKSKLASKVNSIYINSLDKYVNFKEVTVTEQKTLSKTLIENEDRRDIVYDTQCALINNLCLNDNKDSVVETAKNLAKESLSEAAQLEGVNLNSPEGANFASKYTSTFVKKFTEANLFDVYNLTEFDRIHLLMEIYQNNYFKEEVKFKCSECGFENTYNFDFSKVVENFKNFDISDKVCEIEDNKYIYKFTLNYPIVRKVSEFYRIYAKKYKGSPTKDRSVISTLENIDYVNLYIKKIELIDKEEGTTDVADITNMGYSDLERLIEMLPQNVVFSPDNGIAKFVSDNFVDPINKLFSYEKCSMCGTPAPVIDNINSFL